MGKQFRVSQSKVKTKRRCNRAYHHRYVDKLYRKKKGRPLQFGTMIHEMLELHASNKDPFSYLEAIEKDTKKMKVFKAQADEWGDILVDCGLIMEDYLEFWPEDSFTFDQLNGQGAEFMFEIEIMKDVIWNGKIDAKGTTPNGLRWGVEHKTFTRRPNDDDRWRNLQSCSYIRANDVLGWEPLDGIMWDYVKSKPPLYPKVLKDGTLSSARLDTLPSAVSWAIRDWRKTAAKDIKKTKYPRLIEMAEQNQTDYFKRIHTPVQSQVVDMVFTDFEATIRRMVDEHGKCWDMNIDKHCGWCDYEGVCRAELLGDDVDFVKEREYEIKTKSRQEAQEFPPHTADLAGYLRTTDQKGS